MGVEVGAKGDQTRASYQGGGGVAKNIEGSKATFYGSGTWGIHKGLRRREGEEDGGGQRGWRSRDKSGSGDGGGLARTHEERERAARLWESSEQRDWEKARTKQR